MPRFFSYNQNWINIFIRQILEFCANFGRNSNFSLFMNIEWLEMIVSHKKWSILISLTTKKAAYIANSSGSFGYVVTSKQCSFSSCGFIQYTGWKLVKSTSVHCRNKVCSSDLQERGWNNNQNEIIKF